MNARERHLAVSRSVKTLMAVTSVTVITASVLTPPTDPDVMVRISYSKIMCIIIKLVQFYD